MICKLFWACGPGFESGTLLKLKVRRKQPGNGIAESHGITALVDFLKRYFPGMANDIVEMSGQSFSECRIDNLHRNFEI